MISDRKTDDSGWFCVLDQPGWMFSSRDSILLQGRSQQGNANAVGIKTEH